MKRGVRGRYAALLTALTLLGATTLTANERSSVCYGSTEKGRLENGWQLPSEGKNFSAYSNLGAALGRNYVHSSVHAAVLSAYASLAHSRPQTTYVYGETGKASGGEFDPHKTHQNGLSVDFMVPVQDRKGRSVPLPSSVFNKFGYAMEFSNTGTVDDLIIDFDAIADHLLALQHAAATQGIGIRRVIFDNDLQSRLFATKNGSLLKNKLIFSKKTPWVRHDEHYHVDFDVNCQKEYSPNHTNT